MMKNFVKIACLTLLVACNNGIPKGTLTENIDLWESYNAVRYAYDYNLSCFCPVGGIMPARVVVFEDKIEAILDPSTGEQLINPNDSTVVFETSLDLFRTIPELFDLVEEVRKDADDVDVTFDEEYGFPSYISIDRIRNAVDDESTYTIENLEIIE